MSTDEDVPLWLRRSWMWTSRLASPVLTLGATALLAVYAVTTDTTQVVVFCIALVAGLAGTIVAGAKQTRLAELQRDIPALRESATRSRSAVRHLSDRELERIARTLSYFSGERISLFIHCAGHFELVARFSDNPQMRTNGHPIYAIDQGCLGQAWERGFSKEVNVPSPSPDPSKWIQQAKDTWNIPIPIAQNIRMKCRTYVAVRIPSLQGNQPLGVVVFESEHVQADAKDGQILDPEELRKRASSPNRSEGRVLQGILDTVQSLYPNFA